jgi:hypothetical protein
LHAQLLIKPQLHIATLLYVAKILLNALKISLASA